MKNKKNIIIVLISFIFSLLALSFNAVAENSLPEDNLNFTTKKNAPDNLTHAITFIASKPFYSTDGSFLLNGLLGGDGISFFKQTLGLTDKQIEQRRDAAISFFSQRFGIDVNDPKVHFTGFQIDPTTDYRAIMMTGEDAGIGYHIDEGGFIAVVMDTDGLDLRGEFLGQHVPKGTVFAAGGTYVINRPGHKNITIDFHSRGPNLPVGTGKILNCELFNTKWGKGLGWGYTEIYPLPNGKTGSQVRMVLTFPGLGIEETLLGK